jgi:hypothetical protein
VATERFLCVAIVATHNFKILAKCGIIKEPYDTGGGQWRKHLLEN